MILPVVDLLVSHCPYLESLTIMIFRKSDPWSDVNVDNLFLLGKWPRLRMLQLMNISFSLSHTMRVAVGSFFSNNLAIRHLLCLIITDDGDIPNIILPPNCLPHLTYLYADRRTIRAILSCPCSPPRALEQIQALTLNRTFWEQPDSSFQGVNKDALLEVRVFSIQTPDDLRLLGVLFPCIEYLNLEGAIGDEDTETNSGVLMAEWAQRLRSFQNLRTLYGMPLFSPDMVQENPAIIVLLADIFPRLKFLYGTINDSGTEIIRGANGPTWRIAPKPWAAFLDPYTIEEQ
ncbi:hypothetical protein JB92DRAFT_3142776 [Gautieria morchelliformis]|nr:hypothetical protein JB92DRAFT_3142776 [Gautieria morchelliformis]